jgi:hypothetical protein
MKYYKSDDGENFVNLIHCQVYCFNNRLEYKVESTKNPFKIFWLLMTAV